MPEHEDKFMFADRWLRDSARLIETESWEAVVMAAYTAAFHAAQAYVFDPQERTPKTHVGVRAKLNEKNRDGGDLPQHLVSRFGDMGDNRNEAIYSASSSISESDARNAHAWAEQFVAAVRQALS